MGKLKILYTIESDFFLINYLFIRFIFIFDYFINNNLLDDLYFILYKVLKIMLLGSLFLKYFSM